MIFRYYKRISAPEDGAFYRLWPRNEPYTEPVEAERVEGIVLDQEADVGVLLVPVPEHV